MSLLIEATELAELLAFDTPPVVADVRWQLGKDTGEVDFEAAHIPGSQWVDLARDLASEPGAGGRHPLPDADVFEQAMIDIGVSADRTVVVCDAATGLSASRLWWLLTDAGHDDVRILNGGLAAWEAVGLELEQGPATPAPAGDFVARPGKQPVVRADELMSMINSEQLPLLIDVRAAERYAGEVEPIDPVAGHIPGAINAPSTANNEADGRFVSRDALARRFADLGIDEKTIFYCGSGITAAHSLLAMRVAGLPGGRIYPGSWSDWIGDPDHPVQNGPAS